METLFIGRNIIFLPEVDSTNSYAINLLKNVNLAEGSIIHTSNQTKGRGQRGNEWHTEPESNLTLSIILKPGFLELKKHFFLYQVAALACYDVMAELLANSHFDINIKWPNDILVNGKKVAGILIENNIFNNCINQSIVGIGMNLNQSEFLNGMNATSLKINSGKDHDLNAVLKLLCEHFEKHYLRLKNNNFQQISENYLDHLYQKGKWQAFEINKIKQTLLVKGVSEKGLLLLEDSKGIKKEFDVKEVSWIF